MTEIIAVFRSRSHAIDCNRILKALNVPSSLIGTPKEANVGCGLSVKLPYSAFAKVKQVIARENYPSFAGYLKIQSYGGRTVIK
ncbi:MAG: DUF3343 domain-containing protein [Candidatus Coproplasma sp.]